MSSSTWGGPCTQFTCPNGSRRRLRAEGPHERPERAQSTCHSERFSVAQSAARNRWGQWFATSAEPTTSSPARSGPPSAWRCWLAGPRRLALKGVFDPLAAVLQAGLGLIDVASFSVCLSRAAFPIASLALPARSLNWSLILSEVPTTKVLPNSWRGCRLGVEPAVGYLDALPPKPNRVPAIGPAFGPAQVRGTTSAVVRLRNAEDRTDQLAVRYLAAKSAPTASRRWASLEWAVALGHSRA